MSFHDYLIDQRYRRDTVGRLANQIESAQMTIPVADELHVWRILLVAMGWENMLGSLNRAWDEYLLVQQVEAAL